MISGISKKVLFFSFLLINFIQPSKSDVFYKIDNHENKQSSKFIWTKLKNNKIISKSSKLLSSNNYKEDSNDLLIPNIAYKINPAEIESIDANSIAQEIGFESGDSIISINGKKPRDLIDYQILISEEILEISVLDKNLKIHNINIEKDQDTNLGINFKDALFDSIKQCNNRCPFCFIDQQPSGKRKSLYVKDDDYRLSFLYGSILLLQI